MTVTVTKNLAWLVTGPPNDEASVTKVVAWLVLDTNATANPGSPKARKKVKVSGRILYQEA